MFVSTAVLASFCSSATTSPLPLPYLISGLLMAYSSRFFNLASFLWAPPAATDPPSFSPDLMWMFAYLLFFMATVRAVQGTT